MGLPSTLKLEVFIKTPETLFEFPLFAIGLDWLELAIILKSTNELSTEAYLVTHKRLKWIFFGTATVIILLILSDLIFNFMQAGAVSHSLIAQIDCNQSLITASFSSCVLALFICAYISLVFSIGQI